MRGQHDVTSSRRARVAGPGLPPIATSGSPLALTVARLLDQRLQATVDDPFALPHARLYGCTVQDDAVRGAVAPVEGALRLTFLGEATPVYELLDGPLAVVARAFDAAATATVGWGAPLDADGTLHARPSRHPARFRTLVCAAIDDAGQVCAVIRDARRPDEPIEVTDRGVGLLPDALDAMWGARSVTR